jgi:Protein of unknown function (DUF3142)
MIPKRKHMLALFLFLPLIALGSCSGKTPSRNRLDENHFPRTILWAWERPEDLRAIDSKRFAVAFLAQTLVLTSGEVRFDPRHQPLDVSPETHLMAVTRVETQRMAGKVPQLSEEQQRKTVSLILKTLELPNVSAIQVDFDAARSERDFYRALLQDLRHRLPDHIPLSITALASFCVGDRWISDLPIDEAVPMAFRMGADDKAIRTLLADGEDFREPLCRRSYGVAIDEPLEAKLDPGRRLYIFNHQSWKASDLAERIGNDSP